MVFVLEVLGLGLGVAPLIIELLKANPQPVHAVKALRTETAKGMMEDFYVNLEFELSMLHITLTDLVQELPVDDDLKIKLLHPNNLDTTIWRDPPLELERCLERRLSPCLETFQRCMEKILYQLSKLVKDNSLPVPVPSQQTTASTGKSYARLEDFLRAGVPAAQKLKFAWRKDKRDKLLVSISKYNSKLQTMLGRTSSQPTSEVPYQPVQQHGCVPHLGLRQRMTELCQAIGRAWCKCKGHHEMRLGLSQAEINDAHVTLDMLLNLSKEDQRYQWAESKMKIHLQSESPTPRPTSSSLIRHGTIQGRRRSSTLTGSTLVASPEGSPMTESPSMPSRLGSPLSPTLMRDAIYEDTTAVHEAKREAEASQVDELCRVVKNGHRVRRASQISFRDDELWHHPPVCDTAVSHSHPGVGLTEYILDKRWTMEDRKVLQVLLAHSILFFPWKAADLNKSAIAFHHQPPRKPFATFQPDHGSDSPEIFPEADDLDSPFQPYQNDTLAALATVLLEIEMQKPIEAMTIEDDVADEDPRGFLTRFWTTSRVLQEQKSNMYRGCYDSIDACIRCDFVDGSADLGDMAFLEKVYERVVAPLENELWNGFGLRLPLLEDTKSTEQQKPSTRSPPWQTSATTKTPSPSSSGPGKPAVQLLDADKNAVALSNITNKNVKVAVKLEIPEVLNTAKAAT